MTCEDVMSMKRVKISRTYPALEQVKKAEMATGGGKKARPTNDGADDEFDEAEQLALALKLSLDGDDSGVKNRNEIWVDDGSKGVLSEGGVNDLFNSLLDLATRSFQRDVAEGAELIQPLLNCLLGMIVQSESEELQIQRGKAMIESFCKNIDGMVKNCSEDAEKLKDDDATKAEELKKKQMCLNVALCALSSLVEGQSRLEVSPKLRLGPKQGNVEKESKDSKTKTDPRFVCSEHGVPAVRRRCSKGVHRDRRFYV